MDPRPAATSVLPDKPSLLTALGVLTLLSGLVNIGWGIAGLASLFGLVCAPLAAVPVVLGGFEVGYAVRLLSTRRGLRPATSIAGLELACALFGNLFATMVGILALVFYKDLTVQAFFEASGGRLAVQSPSE